MFDGPIGIGFNPTKWEEMDMRDAKIRIGGFMGRKIAQEFVRGEGQKQFGEIFGTPLQHPQGGAHTTGDRKFDQGLQLGRAGHADVYGQGDAICRQLIGPVNHRGRLKTKLRCNGHICVGGL